jgi:murein DD-endopeptidase MepM/ murein hydrolase activator NlpD
MKSVATTSRQKAVHVTGSQAGVPHSAARSKVIRDNANRKMAQKAAKQKTAKTARRTKESLARMVKAITSAMKSLVAALGVGGSVILFIVILIIIIGAIVASPFGIFFSNDSVDGMTMKEVAAQLNDEFSAEVQKIEDENAHDELEIVSNGGFIDWKEVIAVFACKVSEDSDNPLDVVSIDDNKLSILRTVMFDMNKITSETKSVTKDRTVTTTDEEGNEVQETESVTITVLVITIIHKTAEQMADDYGFSKSQKDSLAELLDPTNDDLWAELIGGYSSGGGSGEPSKDRVPKDIFSWPLEVSGTITSWFGYRKDPITGEVKYHDGTDIAVPEGTPILAAADGTVSVANGTDSYGGGWGYYVKIKHNGTYDSLYAHCQSIAVKNGDAVTKGQIIGYVGTTGRSTGPHLHFEIYMNGVRTDALSYFE